MSSQPLSIVGTGVLGTSLALLLRQAQVEVRLMVGRTPDRARAAAARVGCDWALGAASVTTPWVLIAVPDDSVETVAQELAAAWQSGAPPNAAVIHTSGVSGSDILAPLRACGAEVGVSHPLQSVANVETAVEWLPRSVFGVSPAPMARWLPQSLGASFIEVADEARPFYHAAACVASNYMPVLLEVAAGLMQEGLGLPPAQAMQALLPLVRGTLENIDRWGPASALTGPVARGDSGTVRRHLQAMQARQVPASWEGIYRTLGLMALTMARTRSLADEKAAAVERALETNAFEP